MGAAKPSQLSVLLIAMLGCGRIGFGDSGGDSRGVSPDGAPTISGADASAGGQTVVPTFDCVAGAFAVAASPVEDMHEPALRRNGLDLLARVIPGRLLESERSSPTQLFPGWQESTSLSLNHQDPDFFDYQGSERAMVADLVLGERRIFYCSALGPDLTCTQVLIVDDATDQVITDDTDGPDIGFRNGAIVMAFSRGTELYVAEPTDASLLNWRARLLTGLDVAGALDDPSLSDDAQTFAFSETGPNAALYLARWDDAAKDYVGAVEQTSLGHQAGAPLLVGTGATGLQMYYGAPGRNGFTEIFVTQCGR